MKCKKIGSERKKEMKTQKNVEKRKSKMQKSPKTQKKDKKKTHKRAIYLEGIVKKCKKPKERRNE